MGLFKGLVSGTIAACAIAACQPAARSPAPSLKMETCRVKGLPGRVECGQLEVAENAAKPEGRKIQLRIVRLPATRPDPSQPPLFMLAGGPGQAATEAFPAVIAGLGLHRKGRSIVLVDQRGTGASNPLDCETKSSELADQLRTDTDPKELADCRGSLDADLKMYTTPIAADDLDRVREAMGYPAIDILGMSYGTRAGLVYMRRHGSRVRAAILDGAAPPEMNIPLSVAADADRALKRVFEACEKQPSCAAGLGKPSEALATIFEQLGEEGLEVVVRDPISGKSEAVKLTAKAFALLLRTMLYDAHLASLVPLTLSQVAAGNFAPLFAQASLFADAAESGMSKGMMLSVLCAEDLARVEAMEPRAVQSTHQGTFLGAAGLSSLQRACSLWPKAALPSDYSAPVASAVPTLVLSGENDPVTPPRWGHKVVEHLSSGQHVVVPGASHGTVLVGCIPDIVAQFLEEPEKPVETECIRDSRRPPFFVDGAGPPH